MSELRPKVSVSKNEDIFIYLHNKFMGRVEIKLPSGVNRTEALNVSKTNLLLLLIADLFSPGCRHLWTHTLIDVITQAKNLPLQLQLKRKICQRIVIG